MGTAKYLLALVDMALIAALAYLFLHHSIKIL